ncbi:MAG: hypothetical protein QME75_14665 [Deltaproteobacteria bacterium]|nr:hypothetical protein [Desulfitobacteriaceae bacterium]MDI6854832.1 hypothetical protein [Deltaproteobacteria bacterium]
MPRVFQVITAAVALFLVLSGGRQTASAQERRHHYNATKVTEWTAVTGAPGVHHSVMGGHDVFRYQDHYYRYDGRWHRGRHYAGPWVAIPAPPPVIYRVDRVYFKKVPPGWQHGRKTGWQGAPMPPGHMKKYH